MPLRKIGAGRLEQQVQVVPHEDEREQLPAAPWHLAAQFLEQTFTVVVVANHLLSAVPPRDHVVDGTLKLDSRSSWHIPSGTRPNLKLNKNQKQSLTPRSRQQWNTTEPLVQQKPKTKFDTAKPMKTKNIV